MVTAKLATIHAALESDITSIKKTLKPMAWHHGVQALPAETLAEIIAYVLKSEICTSYGRRIRVRRGNA